MTPEDCSFSELAELFVLSLDGRSTEQQRNLLNKKLFESKAARKFYIDFMTTYIGLNYLEGNVDLQDDQEQLLDAEIWEALSESERTANAIEIPKPAEKLERVLVNKVEYKKVPVKINKVSLAVAITASAALIALLVFVRFYPRHLIKEVATLTDSINAKFLSAGNEVGTRFTNDTEPFRLQEGIIKIEFDYGAETIVEGPAEIQFISPEEIFISYGRACASVPSNAMGFTISTPNSSIIDLGTEFGVKVNVDGNTDVQMFSGSASLIAGQKGETKENQVITKGVAKRVDQFRQIQDIAFEEKTLVRQFSSKSGFVWRGRPIDMEDLIKGGNGFGSGKYLGIEFVSGKFVKPEQGQIHEHFLEEMVKYITVEQSFIDGVFIPDSSKGSVQVSSEGHVFENCPDTSSIFWGSVLCKQSIIYSEIRLDGKDYKTDENKAILLHSNFGITFDLVAVKNAYPGLRVKTFSALAGMSESVFEDEACKDWISKGGSVPKANFYVLIDGQERFVREDISPGNEPVPIKIDIPSDSRFLTLITTEGSDNLYRWDWCLFAEPYFVMTSTD